MNGFETVRNNPGDTFHTTPFERISQSGTPPENPVVEIHEIDSQKYGAPSKEEGFPEKIQYEEITFPVYDQGGMFVLKAVRCDVDQYLNTSDSANLQQDQKKDDRPFTTFVIMGGGGSTAVDNLHFLMKTVAGIRNYQTGSKEDSSDNNSGVFPSKVRLVILPHIRGSIHEVNKEAQEEEKFHTFSGTSEVLQKAMSVKELGITPDVGLIGVSAGGGQVLELASELKERCKFIALVDSAGLAEHPNIAYDASIGQFIDAYKKYRQSGENKLQSIKSGLNEMLNAISTKYGNLRNVLDLIRDYTNPVRKEVNKPAGIAWGVEKSKGRVMPAAMLGKDITKDARNKIKAPVIFSPVLYARVVNTLFQRLKANGQVQSILEMQQKREASEQSKQEFDQACVNIIGDLFPNVAKDDIFYSPYESSTHSSVSEQAYWDNLMSQAAEVINPKNENAGI